MSNLKVNKDLVVSMDYELKVENNVVDFSEEGDPLIFLQGHGILSRDWKKPSRG